MTVTIKGISQGKLMKASNSGQLSLYYHFSRLSFLVTGSRVLIFDWVTVEGCNPLPWSGQIECACYFGENQRNLYSFNDWSVISLSVCKVYTQFGAVFNMRMFRAPRQFFCTQSSTKCFVYCFSFKDGKLQIVGKNLFLRLWAEIFWLLFGLLVFKLLILYGWGECKICYEVFRALAFVYGRGVDCMTIN